MGDLGKTQLRTQLSAEAQTWGEAKFKVGYSGSDGNSGVHLLIAVHWFAPIWLTMKGETWGKESITCAILMIVLQLRSIFTCYMLHPASWLHSS